MSREGDGRYNSHDRGRDAYSGSQQDYRDRSRSRDSNYRDSGRGFRDDRRSLPGGRERGSYGRDRRRGGSGGGRHVVQRPDSMIVKTNYYKIVFRAEIFEWIQYKVEIKPGVKAKAPEGSSERYEKNPDGTFKIVPKQRGGTEVDFLDIDQSSAISRRVLKKLSSELYNKKKIYVVTDGSATAYSPQEVLESPRTFSVNVKRDCEEDEDGADRVVNQWFLVTLTQVAKIIPNDQVQGLEAVRQAMDIILRSAMMTAGMTAFGRSPRAFHFPESDQKSLLQGSGKMEALLNRERNYLPLLGIMQAVRVCEKGNKYLNLDTIIDYANREFLPPTPERKYKVQLLDERSKKLCGVLVKEGFRQPITNPTVRKDIEKALLAININVEYKKVPQSDWVRRMKEKGKSDHEIERMKTQVRRNRRMRVDRKNKDSLSFEKSIIWSADDPNEYSFEMERKEQDPLSVTVRQYFLERHGITLRFPKMPLIYVGNGEWFPVEFLFQAFGKMKDANEDHQKNAILDFCDKNAGLKRVENISKAFRKVQSYGLTFEDITKQFNFRVYSTPVEVRAKVLKEPSLKFANDQPASINNGSWNLMGVKFQHPAELRSFAVVDLSHGRAAETFVNKFLRVAASHGMEVPSGVDVQRLITRANDGVGGIQRAVDDAIKRARMYFFQERNNLWFRTRVRSPNGGLPACLVLQNSCNSKAKTYGIMLPKEVCAYTHIFDYQGRENIEGRLVIKVQETFYDPFDFCPNTNDFEFYFEFQDQNIPQNQCQNVRPAIEVKEDDIECPSLVICILPDNKAERYGLVKMCCHFIHGVQSQCIDSSKFLAQQRSKDQYCSNVALKINAKLSNIDNSARGWTTTPNGELNAIAGVTWIKEVHTLVLGISISNSLGHGDDIVSVISASASLDEGCMKFAQEVRVCTKTEVIADSILSYLVKALILQYCLHNLDEPQKGIQKKDLPKRILVYRDGVSEGSFPRVQAWEVQSIRKGYNDFAKERDLLDPDRPCGCTSGGCMFCGPLITFVACMSRNNVKIVPSKPGEGVKRNVHSGTCVDSTVIDNLTNLKLFDNDTKSIQEMKKRGYLYTEPDGSGYDFLLTAHGGGLGTSKPVHYRIILNENGVFRPNDTNKTATPLTKSKLEQATYEMSFQYSTATKAVRLVPVVYYSARYSETVLKYFNYLKNEGMVEKVKMDDSGLEPIIGRDGAPKPRFVYVRKELLQTSIQDSTILPKFSARKFNKKNGKDVDFVANYTHLSA